MDVKFHYKGSVKTVLFNSEVDSNWGTAHEITDPFPFNESDPFNVQILLQMPSFKVGARCSSVVRAFAHGAMGRQIDPSR